MPRAATVKTASIQTEYRGYLIDPSGGVLARLYDPNKNPLVFGRLPVPRDRLARKVGRTSWKVYEVLVEFRNGETGLCWMSNANIAKAAGVSLASVQNSMTQLRKAGLVVPKKVGKTKDGKIIWQKMVTGAAGTSGVVGNGKSTTIWVHATTKKWFETETRGGHRPGSGRKPWSKNRPKPAQENEPVAEDASAQPPPEDGKEFSDLTEESNAPNELPSAEEFCDLTGVSKTGFGGGSVESNAPDVESKSTPQNTTCRSIPSLDTSYEVCAQVPGRAQPAGAAPLHPQKHQGQRDVVATPPAPVASPPPRPALAYPPVVAAVVAAVGATPTPPPVRSPADATPCVCQDGPPAVVRVGAGWVCSACAGDAPAPGGAVAFEQGIVRGGVTFVPYLPVPGKAGVPRYPGPTVMPPVELRPPPQLPAGLDDDRLAEWLLRAFRGVYANVYKKRCWAFGKPGSLKKSPKNWRAVMEAAQYLEAAEWSPGIWVMWSFDQWREINGPKKDPPLSWVFSRKRMEEHCGWFESEYGHYACKRFIYPHLHKQILTRYEAMMLGLAHAGGTATQEVRAQIIERYFPGQSFDEWVRMANARAQDDQRRINDMMRRGEWCWT